MYFNEKQWPPVERDSGPKLVSRSCGMTYPRLIYTIHNNGGIFLYPSTGDKWAVKEWEYWWRTYVLPEVEHAMDHFNAKVASIAAECECGLRWKIGGIVR
jgi:hypothetical protein